MYLIFHLFSVAMASQWTVQIGGYPTLIAHTCISPALVGAQNSGRRSPRLSHCLRSLPNFQLYVVLCFPVKTSSSDSFTVALSMIRHTGRSASFHQEMWILCAWNVFQTGCFRYYDSEGSFAWQFVVTVPYFVDTFLWMCLPLPDRVHGSRTFGLVMMEVRRFMIVLPIEIVALSYCVIMFKWRACFVCFREFEVFLHVQ
jgi:hypothetical protein